MPLEPAWLTIEGRNLKQLSNVCAICANSHAPQRRPSASTLLTNFSISCTSNTWHNTSVTHTHPGLLVITTSHILYWETHKHTHTNTHTAHTYESHMCTCGNFTHLSHRPTADKRNFVRHTEVLQSCHIILTGLISNRRSDLAFPWDLGSDRAPTLKNSLETVVSRRPRRFSICPRPTTEVHIILHISGCNTRLSVISGLDWNGLECCKKPFSWHNSFLESCYSLSHFTNLLHALFSCSASKSWGTKATCIFN